MPEPTQEQIEAARLAMIKLREGCRSQGSIPSMGALAEAALTAAAAVTPEKDVLAAIDEFSKATNMPGGPSLAIQRHDPSWEAWKKICHAAALTSEKDR